VAEAEAVQVELLAQVVTALCFYTTKELL
jgi:hypothetical protein